MSLLFELKKIKTPTKEISSFNDSYSAFAPEKHNGRRLSSSEEHREITLYFNGEYDCMIAQVYSFFYDTWDRTEADKMAEDILEDLRGQGLEEI